MAQRSRLLWVGSRRRLVIIRGLIAVLLTTILSLSYLNRPDLKRFDWSSHEEPTEAASWKILESVGQKSSCLSPPILRYVDSRQHVIWVSPEPALPPTTPLFERLERWNQSLIANRKDWVAFNSFTCGDHVSSAFNKLHTSQNIKKGTWELSADKIYKIRVDWISYLESKPIKLIGVPGKRGLVFTAGNANTFQKVIWTLKLLRSYGCRLKAEIFHFPSEQPSEVQVGEYKKLQASTVSVPQERSFGRPGGNPKAFWIKAWAFKENSFGEFIYLDSDSIPTRDITGLFFTPGYKETGAIFWPDYWKDSPHNPIWQILGVQCRDEWTMEAGQVVINKRMHMDALELFSYILTPPKSKFSFIVSDGDKDLLRYVFLGLRKRWAVPTRTLQPASWKHPPSDNFKIDIKGDGMYRGHGDFRSGDASEPFCGHTMMQFGPTGMEGPLFVHENMLKRVQLTLQNGTTWGLSRQLNFPASDISPNNAFPVLADHVANLRVQVVDNDAVDIVAISNHPDPKQRWVAFVESGIRSYFYAAHMQQFYLHCLDQGWQNPLSFTPLVQTSSGTQTRQKAKRTIPFLRRGDIEQPFLEEIVRSERRALKFTGAQECRRVGLSPGRIKQNLSEVTLGTFSWENDPILRDLENKFYMHQGVANGFGF